MDFVDVNTVDLEEFDRGGESEIHRWRVNGTRQKTLLKIYVNCSAEKLEARLRIYEQWVKVRNIGDGFLSLLDERLIGLPKRIVTDGKSFIGIEIPDGTLQATSSISALPDIAQLISSDMYLHAEKDYEHLGLVRMTANQFQYFAFQVILVGAWLHHVGMLMVDFSAQNLMVYKSKGSFVPYFIDTDGYLPSEFLSSPGIKETIGQTPGWTNFDDSEPCWQLDVWKVGLLFRRMTGLSSNRAATLPCTKHDKKALVRTIGNEAFANQIWNMSHKNEEMRPTFLSLLQSYVENGLYGSRGGLEISIDRLRPHSSLI